MKKDFVEGAKAATPIILGYIPVGIAYGMLAKATGLTFFKALSFSLFVYTGAGQMAAVTMLAQNAAYVTIVFTVFILNLRHIIMSTCIMEKMEKTSLPIRLLLSFWITDEVFAVSMTDKKINKLTPAFLAGLSLFSYLFWNVGSALGILFSSVLPSIVSKSLGVSLYAMFIGLLVPNMKKSIRLLYVVVLSMIVNWVLNQFLSSSLSILILCIDRNVFYFQGGFTMKFVGLIFFLCLSTYIPRMLPALFMDKIQVSKKVNIFLQLIPYTAMASLIFPAILYVDENVWIGIIASVVAVIAALKKLPVIGVVLASVISCVIFYMFMLS